jgi:LmbE family N-acetylglucosaminyl deacetylase
MSVVADSVGLHMPCAGDRVLVLAPHQDDESIGCGGALVRWRRTGAYTGVLWVSAAADGSVVGAEALAAGEILGLAWHAGLGQATVGLTVSTDVLEQALTRLREFAPTVLVIPHADEDDLQHRVTHALGMELAWLADYDWPSAGARHQVSCPRLVLAYEVWTPMTRPTTYLNVAECIDAKCAAISAYKTQTEIVDFAGAARSLNRYRGLMSGSGKFSEAFFYVKGRSF